MKRREPNFRIHANTRIARGDDVFPIARRTAHTVVIATPEREVHLPRLGLERTGRATHKGETYWLYRSDLPRIEPEPMSRPGWWIDLQRSIA